MGTRFSACPDRPWGPPSLLYNGYRVFPGGKVRPGRAADHSTPSSAAVMEEYSYTSTQPLGHTGPVTGSLYLYRYQTVRWCSLRRSLSRCIVCVVGVAIFCDIMFIVLPLIIIIIIISFMQCIYTYIPQTNYVPREYSVKAILLLLFMVLISLVSVLNLLYFNISTFRSMCTVPNMAVFCSSLISCFPGMLLTYFLNDFEIVPVAPIITGIIFVFYIPRALYFYCKVFVL